MTGLHASMLRAASGLKAWALRADALLTRRRVRDYSLMAAGTLLVTVVILFVVGHPPLDALGRPLGGDFSAHLTAGAMVLCHDTDHLYDANQQQRVEARLIGSADGRFYAPFISPPFVAWLYAPFAALPYVIAAATWIALTAGLLVASVLLLWPLVPRLHASGLGIVMVVFLSSQPAMQLLLDGQDSGLSLLLLVVGLRLLVVGRDVAAGAIIGAGVFKPQLFLLMPALLIFERRWRAASAWIIVAAGFVCLSVVLAGPATLHAYTALLASDVYRKGIVEEQAWKMQSLSAFAHTLAPGAMTILSRYPVVTGLIGFACGAAALGAIRRTRGRTAGAAMPLDRGAADTPGDLILIYALAVLLTALVNPHMFLYDCVVLLLPILVLLDRDPASPEIRLCAAAIYVLTWTTPFRHYVFGRAPWPLSLTAAAWTVVPVVLLLRLGVRLYRRS